MSLQAPKLDDRSFDDLLQEARQRIQQLCPEWTDFNPSDPGMTLVELMAWLTETMLYRLNRVPEKNYIKFLELMGVRLKSARPATAWVAFEVAKGARERDLPRIPAGSHVSTRGDHGVPVVFETTRPTQLTSASLVGVYSRCGELSSDHTESLAEAGQGTTVFCGKTWIPHTLYLGSISGMERLPAGLRLQVDVELATALAGNLLVEWERWDGESWEIVLPVEDQTNGLRRSGSISFEVLPNLERNVVNGTEAYWLRARVVGAEEGNLPTFIAIQRRLEVTPGHESLPDKAFTSSEAAAFAPIDLGREFYPFGKESQPHNLFYLSGWAFSRPHARVSMTIQLAASSPEVEPHVRRNTRVDWEYPTTAGIWKKIGVSSDEGVLESACGLTDSTGALSRSGTISFDTPEDMAASTIHGEEGRFIRGRLVPARSPKHGVANPLLESVVLSVSERSHDWDSYLAENYFSYENLTSAVEAERPFEPFLVDSDKDPALYLALNRRPSNRSHRFFFNLAGGAAPVDAAPMNLQWEYRDRTEWKPLRILNDGTRQLSRSGGVDFIAPLEWPRRSMFGTRARWLRIRLEAGTYSKPVRLRAIHLNAARVAQAIGQRLEVLGSSTGRPHQEFAFRHHPVLPDPRILIKEVIHPSEEEIEDLESSRPGEVVKEHDSGGNVRSLWVRWQAVENFFGSQPDDRHYVLDPELGRISFGDGRRGSIPPPISGGVKAEVYYIGGGAKGNVGVGTITVLEEAIPSVAGVSNITAAEGGADAETVEEARLRGPWILRHQDRAVTPEDFERLAKEASSDVALARCFAEGGEIRVVIIPGGEGDKPRPSQGLINTVTRVLDSKRLVTTKLRVLGPEYEPIEVQVRVALETEKADAFPEIREDMDQRLRRFFHPLWGGPYDTGWPLGRSVHLSELYYQLEVSEGVDFVDKLNMKRVSAAEWTDRIKLASQAYPYLRSVSIEQV